MGKKLLFLFKSFVGGWILYLPYYLMQAFSLWVGYLLLKPPLALTFLQLLGLVIVIRILRGLVTKAGNIVSSELMKEQIAKDAWDKATSEAKSLPMIDRMTFADWFKAYRKTIAE